MNTNSSKPKRKVQKLSTTSTVLLFVCVALMFIMYQQRKTRNNYREASALPFHEISLADVKDGTYRQKTDTSFMHLTLDVTVKNHKLVKIDILENRGSVGQNIKRLADMMIEKNQVVMAALDGEELASIVFISCVDSAIAQGVESKDSKD